MKTGPIIIIEDDLDDQELFELVLNGLKVENVLLFFEESSKALSYLTSSTDHPFIIFCDINMPGMNGIELKKIIDRDETLRKKSIPFIFYSTAIDQRTVNQAYSELTIQGFFKKEMALDEIRQTIAVIINYWKRCRHPYHKIL